MIFFKNIFASIYFYYKQKKYEDARYNGILGVLILISSGFFILYLIAALILKIELFNTFHLSKYWIVPFLVLLFFLINRYYSKEKVGIIMEEFEAKPINRKKAWLVFFVLLFFLLLVITIILIQMVHGKI